MQKNVQCEQSTGFENKSRNYVIISYIYNDRGILSVYKVLDKLKVT